MKDRRHAGRSVLVPYREGETSEERHARRLRENLAAEPTVRAFCVEQGITLTLDQGGERWVFAYGQRSAMWRPADASMHFDDNSWSVHAHDYAQVIGLLGYHWNIDRRRSS